MCGQFQYYSAKILHYAALHLSEEEEEEGTDKTPYGVSVDDVTVIHKPFRATLCTPAAHC